MSARSWLSLFAALLAASCEREAELSAKPNVVVIVIDTLRPDHLQSYGYPTDTAPFLAELAAGGAQFSRAWSSSSWTAPATASLFTSLYPQQHGVLEGFFVHRVRAMREGATQAEAETITLARLPSQAASMPEIFRDAGWSTWGISANVNVTERIGFDRGFEHFRTLTEAEHGKGGAADLIAQELQQWGRSMHDAAPYFLYLHFNDVHGPWHGRPPLFEEGQSELATERAAYDSEIHFVDRALRACFDGLNWNSNTLICVVSDHGEEFEEHGGRGHGLSLYRELLQVAWLAWAPGRVRAGLEIDDNVSLIDVLPTVAELAGVTVTAEIEGRSLAPLLALDAPDREPLARTLFAHRKARQAADDVWSVIAGEWKLIEHSGTLELYDLRDRAERDDLAAQQPEVVERLARELDTFRARAKPLAGETVDVELDARTLESLRQLGYTR